jgi:hypothetical protein
MRRTDLTLSLIYHVLVAEEWGIVFLDRNSEQKFKAFFTAAPDQV